MTCSPTNTLKDSKAAQDTKIEKKAFLGLRIEFPAVYNFPLVAAAPHAVPDSAKAGPVPAPAPGQPRQKLNLFCFGGFDFGSYFATKAFSKIEFLKELPVCSTIRGHVWQNWPSLFN